jgi:hypothetical protein
MPEKYDGDLNQYLTMMLWVSKIKRDAKTGPCHGKGCEATIFYGMEVWIILMRYDSYSKLFYGHGFEIVVIVMI